MAVQGFLVHGRDAFHAIEVKNTAEVRPADLRPRQAFADDYPERRLLLLYRGKHRLRERFPCTPRWS